MKMKHSKRFHLDKLFWEMRGVIPRAKQHGDCQEYSKSRICWRRSIIGSYATNIT